MPNISLGDACMNCSNCIYYRRVKWASKDIRLACLNGIPGQFVHEDPVDGGKLALTLGFGVQYVFDRAAQGKCNKFTDRIPPRWRWLR